MAKKHINKSQVANRYAQAVFELACDEKNADKSLKDTAQQLLSIKDLIVKSADLTSILNNPTLAKTEVANATLAIIALLKPSKLVTKFCQTIAENGRLNILPEISQEFDKILSHHNQEEHAIISSATPLAKATAKEITQSLEKITGKNILLDEQIDTSLIGGFTLQIGSQMLDSSIAGKLDNMELHLRKAG